MVRVRQRRERVSAELLARNPTLSISGTDNLTAVEQCDVAILAVPYSAQERTLDGLKDALAGKLLITVVAPTGEKKARVYRLESGCLQPKKPNSNSAKRRRLLPPSRTLAHNLLDIDYQLDCDVLICGQKAVDKDIAMQLCTDAGLRRRQRRRPAKRQRRRRHDIAIDLYQHKE